MSTTTHATSARSRPRSDQIKQIAGMVAVGLIALFAGLNTQSVT